MRLLYCFPTFFFQSKAIQDERNTDLRAIGHKSKAGITLKCVSFLWNCPAPLSHYLTCLSSLMVIWMFPGLLQVSDQASEVDIIEGGRELKGLCHFVIKKIIISLES